MITSLEGDSDLQIDCAGQMKEKKDISLLRCCFVTGRTEQTTMGNCLGVRSSGDNRKVYCHVFGVCVHAASAFWVARCVKMHLSERTEQASTPLLY